MVRNVQVEPVNETQSELALDEEIPSWAAEVARRRQPAVYVSSAVERAEFSGPWESQDTRTSTIGCVIPAYNEEETIGAVIESLLKQTHAPDEIHVVTNNCSDDTFWVASEYAGEYRVSHRGTERTVKVFAHDAGNVPDKKVGALNIGFGLVEHCDYLLGVDGDTILHNRAVQQLLDEVHSDSRIGGVSGIYTVDYHEKPRGLANYLIAGQRQQFAAFSMQNLLRGRNMAVLGGQCSLFSVPALQAVRDQYRQLGPWVSDSEVEDSLLSLQLKRLGYATKISSTARASVGGMTTLSSLDAQQVKWNYGSIDLMWPGQRGNTRGMPFHPNLRIRWFEHWSMLLNLLVRTGFLLLLAASLSIGAFVFNPLWLIPPVVSIALNLRTALTMQDRTTKDVLFALLFLPGEIYMWIKIGHFVRAWLQFFFRSGKTDNWAAQAAAESGKGGNAYLQPLVFGVVLLGAIVLLWFNMPLLGKEIALWFAWPLLAVLTIMQTLGMLFRLIRPHRGFTV